MSFPFCISFPLLDPLPSSLFSPFISFILFPSAVLPSLLPCHLSSPFPISYLPCSFLQGPASCVSFHTTPFPYLSSLLPFSAHVSGLNALLSSFPLPLPRLLSVFSLLLPFSCQISLVMNGRLNSTFMTMTSTEERIVAYWR